MKKQEYIVRKYNESGCNYDNRFHRTYKDAYADTHKGDVMLICKPDSVYYGDNCKGWTVDSNDIIRVVSR